MNRQQIIDLAQEITNGTEVKLVYEKPAEVLCQRNFLKSQNVLKEKLPSRNNGGNEPSAVLTKHSEYTFTYDERNYFRQVLEEQAQNLNAQKPELYKKVRGMYYKKLDNEKDFVRIASRKDRLEISAKYFDETGKSKPYKHIEKYLKASAKKDYESYNCQMDTITSTGKAPEPESEILPINFEVDRIVSIEILHK